MSIRRNMVLYLGGLALALAGCDVADDNGPDGNGNANLNNEDRIILDVVTHSAVSYNMYSSQSARQPMASVELAGSVKSSYTMGPAPTYTPFTVTLAFTNEPIPGYGGSALFNGGEIYTIHADDSVSGNLQMVSTYRRAKTSDGLTIDGTMVDMGTISGSMNKIVVNVTSSSDDFTIDGLSHRVRLRTRIAASQQGTSSGSATGNIDGKPVSYDF